MIRRSVFRFTALLLAVFIVGCDDDDPVAPEVPFDVTPLFIGIAEGDQVQLTATLGGQPAQVTWASSDVSIATVTSTGPSTGLVTGIGGGSVAVTATLASDPQRLRSSSITVVPIPTLTSGVAVTGLSGTTGSQRFWKIVVPAGATGLTVALSGGSGDADLYVRFGARPTLDDFDCAPFLGGNNENCIFANPAAGTWYIMLDAFSAYSGATLRATITP